MHDSVFYRRSSGVVMLLGALFVMGCGGSTTSPVSGTIQLNGKAPGISGLHIAFMGSNGVPVMMPIQPDGSYQGRAPNGEVLVGFSYVPENDEAAMEEYARVAKPVGEGIDPKSAPKDHFAPDKVREREAIRAKGESAIRGPKSPIPQKLEDPRQSGIKTTITTGTDNRFDHDIK